MCACATRPVFLRPACLLTVIYIALQSSQWTFIPHVIHTHTTGLLTSHSSLDLFDLLAGWLTDDGASLFAPHVDVCLCFFSPSRFAESLLRAVPC